MCLLLCVYYYYHFYYVLMFIIVVVSYCRYYHYYYHYSMYICILFISIILSGNFPDVDDSVSRKSTNRVCRDCCSFIHRAESLHECDPRSSLAFATRIGQAQTVHKFVVFWEVVLHHINAILESIYSIFNRTFGSGAFPNIKVVPGILQTDPKCREFWGVEYKSWLLRDHLQTVTWSLWKCFTRDSKWHPSRVWRNSPTYLFCLAEQVCCEMERTSWQWEARLII